MAGDASAYAAIGGVSSLGWDPIGATSMTPWTDDRSSPLGLWLAQLGG